MTADSPQVRSTGDRKGRGRHRAPSKRNLEPYNWLGAGAITLSVAVGGAFVTTPGVAQATKGSHHSHTSSNGSSGKSGADSTSSGGGSKTTHTQKTKPSTSSASNSALKIGVGGTSSTTVSHKHDTKSNRVTSANATSTPAAQTTTTDSTSNSAAGTFAPFAHNAVAVTDSLSPTAPKELSVATVNNRALTSLPNPLTLVGGAIAYDIRGIQHQMIPLISGVLGVYHLEAGLTEFKSLHVIDGSLDLLSAGLSLAIVGLNALPGGALLIPPTAVLASTTATVNTIGQDLLHW